MLKRSFLEAPLPFVSAAFGAILLLVCVLAAPLRLEAQKQGDSTVYTEDINLIDFHELTYPATWCV